MAITTVRNGVLKKRKWKGECVHCQGMFTWNDEDTIEITETAVTITSRIKCVTPGCNGRVLGHTVHL